MAKPISRMGGPANPAGVRFGRLAPYPVQPDLSPDVSDAPMPSVDTYTAMLRQRIERAPPPTAWQQFLRKLRSLAPLRT